MIGKKFVALKPFNNKIYYKNAIFDGHSSTGSFYVIAAQKLLKKNNIIMNTIDISPDTYTLKDVYIEVPYPWNFRLWARIIKNRKKNILFIGEPPLVNPFSFMKVYLFFFPKVYTWNDNLVDNKKYFKYVLPKKTTKIAIKRVPFKDKKLIILMNSNLLPFLPFQLLSLSTKELYTERVRAIDFFDKYYPSDFYLYGKGWNKQRRFSIRDRLFGYKKYKTYKGEFLEKDKYKILSQFKFCLCFENSAAIGYVSEKIFDCFKARCVPIYLGAPNISDHINPKCFIDYRKFKSYKDLADFLTNMDEKTYNTYIAEIEKFIESQELKDVWSADAFAKTLLKSIFSDWFMVTS